jgi:Ca2+-binding RTX toxin-like protein
MPTIKGNDNNNVLVGTSGDDDIFGYDGQDVLIGSGGNDWLDGGTGADTMDGGIGDDTYIVDNAKDQVVEYENHGIDTIRTSITYSLTNADNVERLTLTGTGDINGYGNGLDNVIYGNSGDNDIYGYNGNDILKGGGGDDYISGGVGDDQMFGGSGNDTMVVNSAADVVTEYANQGIDTVSSSVNYTLGANVENLILTGSAISGYGNELNNELTGNAQDNTLNGGAGADTMRGGLGNDTYYVDNVDDHVVELAGGGNDTVYSSVGFELGLYLENLVLTGSALANGYGNDSDNAMLGNSAHNVLYGYGGVDVLNGYLGADTMYGGQGTDYYTVDNDGDLVIELFDEGDADTVFVQGDMSYTLTDNVEVLQLDYNNGHSNGTGNALNNLIYGSIYDNVLDGGLGQDTMWGFTGNDTYYIDNVNDYAGEQANEGNDTVISTLNYTLNGNIENLTLIGAAVSGMGNNLDNTITGNGSDNILTGGLGSDTIFGGAGADLITGGVGGDVLRGGFGGDTFILNVGDNGDLIQNFNEGGVKDIFDLRGYFDGTGYAGTDPRADGILGVFQNGADTDVYLHGAFAFRIEGVVAAAIDDTYFMFQ